MVWTATHTSRRLYNFPRGAGRPFSADRSGAETISSQNVRVEFSLEDMDMSRFQQGATYEQIQKWVQEKYGFHVTHLNIAKTKRKSGSSNGRTFFMVSGTTVLAGMVYREMRSGAGQ